MKGLFKKSKGSKKQNKYKDSLPHCGACGLSKQCFSPRMEVAGNGRKQVLFVLDAPSESDDRLGEPCVGESGDLLRDTLMELGESLDECWTTYSVICSPSGENLQSKHVDACRPNLLKTIKELDPKVVVLFGMRAIRSLIGIEWKRNLGKQQKWAGWQIPNTNFNLWVCPVWDPKFLIQKDKNEMHMKEFRDQLEAVFDLERQPRPNKPSLDDLEQQVDIITDGKKARQRLRELISAEGLLAFDYETTGLKPDKDEHEIVSCSFCLNGDDTFAMMIDERSKRVLSKVLQNEKLGKIASNLKFEERWTRAKLGHGVANWYWDTMITSHILDNRSGITSVKFQSFVHLGVGGYDETIKPYLKGKDSKDANSLNRVHEIEEDKLLLYNGLDSLLEYKVCEYQKQFFNM